MQIVDIKGLQYITNLLSSHSGLYLDVKQIEGKYKVGYPAAVIALAPAASDRSHLTVCRSAC